MKRKTTIPKFKTDRKAADFWAAHDSSPHLSELRQVSVRVSPALQRAVAERAAAKKPVTLRLEP